MLHLSQSNIEGLSGGGLRSVFLVFRCNEHLLSLEQTSDLLSEHTDLVLEPEHPIFFTLK